MSGKTSSNNSNSYIAFLNLWLPVIAWAALIFYLSGVPNLKSGLEYDFVLRKAAHIIEYLILTLLLCRAFRGSFGMKGARLLLYPAVVSFFYAVSDEIHQSFIAGRSCAIQDVMIDSIGILIAVIMVRYRPLVKR